MSPEHFLQFANLLSEPLVLVSGEGTLLAANHAFVQRLRSPLKELAGNHLAEWVTDALSTIVDYLFACSRTRVPLPGSLVLQDAEGKSLPCRCEGAVVAPRSGDNPALILLRFIPRAEATSQFLLLNQRIDALTHEIAARKKAEEELEASNIHLKRAINETHHRVKNNLQAVSALLEMQKQDEIEGQLAVEAIDESLLQIKTIALVHDLLTHDGPLGGVDAREVLEKLVALLRQSTSHIGETPSVRLEADSVLLSTKSATALALLTNELISNTFKHGKSLRRGETTDATLVRLSRRAEEIIVEVQDRGPGFPPDFDPLLHGHLGLELVQSLVENDLRGTLTFGRVEAAAADVSSPGGRVTIRFSAESLVEV